MDKVSPAGSGGDRADVSRAGEASDTSWLEEALGAVSIGRQSVPGESEQSSTLSALLDEITSHLFLSGSPDVRETEVWTWLQRVSQEFEALRTRNRKLMSRVSELERSMGAGRRMTEDQLLAELPGRTARVLRSAQEVGEEIIQRSKERAAVMEQEARQHAADVRWRAEAEANSMLKQAEQDAQAQVSAARSSGRDMVIQAKELRERILADLSQRQAALELEIEQLQAGRDRLFEAYAAVKRTFDEATSAFTREELTSGDHPGHAPSRRRLAPRRPAHERRTAGPEPAPVEEAPAEYHDTSPGGPPSKYTVRASPSGRP